MTIPAAERRDRLRLARTDNVGPVAFRELMTRYGSAGRALEALPDLARRGGRVDPLRIVSVAGADAELAAGAAAGATLLTVGESEFPRLLAMVDPPPPVIWALGNVALLARPAVAVVGARIASAAGQRFARALAADLGAAGQVVVSGMARGVDAAAHEGALATGTVAVLAGAVDDIYPPEHTSLHRQIVELGCVVSERMMGHRAQAKDFPRRNRLISGLSLGVVVVEAELRSGSLITARLAGEQGREVWAVPGSPLDPRARGTNDLLRQGAAICEGAEDVLRALEATPLHLREQGDLFEPATPDQEAMDHATDSLRARVEALLSPTPTPRDDLVRALGAPAPVVLAALVELSLAGRAELLPGGLVARG